jgi:hypothetical protein
MWVLCGIKLIQSKRTVPQSFYPKLESIGGPVREGLGAIQPLYRQLQS